MVWLRWQVRAEDADWEGTRMDMTGNEYIRGTAQVEWFGDKVGETRLR